MPGGMAAGPMPPNMHWFVVLILSFISMGLGGLVWTFKEAGFVKKIDPASKATTMFALGLLAMVGQVAISFVMMRSASMSEVQTMSMVIMALNVLIIVVMLMGIFGMRKSLVRYYNTVEPMGLRLSGVMTFFFSILYFQYHFSRIAKWKTTGVLS
jgi:FlaA1/EpsC-like NDP-sugar epimerase